MRCALLPTVPQPTGFLGLSQPSTRKKSPGKGKQSNGMFGSTAGDVQEQPWDILNSAPQIKRLIFQTPFELHRGKFPDLRVTGGESLVKSIKGQNALKLLQQQSAEISPFLQNSCA